MTPDLEQGEKLRRLLALKRHEVPPPGFFEAFPERVRARLLAEAGQPTPAWWERLGGGILNRFWRPVLAGACVVLAAGIWVWQSGRRPHPTPGLAHPLAGEPAVRPWMESSLTPATASGPFPGTPEAHVGGPVPARLGQAPPGLFAPGAGLRGGLVPVAMTGAVSGLTVTGVNASGPRAR